MQFIRNLYFSKLFFYALSGAVGLFVLSFFFPAFFLAVKLLFLIFAAVVLLDAAVVFSRKNGVFASRSMPEKLSNGSQNPIFINLENRYTFKINTDIIDELPFQFQKRDTQFKVSVPPGETRIIQYELRPVTRGVYIFGSINVLVYGPFGLVKKRYKFAQDHRVPVYPSFIQMRQYELLAASQRLSEVGIKRIRQVGHSTEFEQIRTYVPGDDQRTINWQASARKAELMVNSYQTEKSQPVYLVIDKGRVMQMPFEGMSLLDYAINAALVLANIALKKQDKAGIITFSDTMGTILPAEGKALQIQKILDLLYNQKTRFLESDFERLYATIRGKIKQRSLFILFTNFETLNGAQRQLPYLRQLARHHLLLVVFFENTETRQLLQEPAQNTEEIYTKAIAEKFASEKRQLVKEFKQHGIQAILTPPDQLTVNTLNKYLEFKARGLI